MSKRLPAIKQLIEDNPRGPNINLGRNLRLILPKALRTQIIISANALTRQLNPTIPIAHRLTQPKIQDLHLPMMKHDVSGLEVVEDDLLFQVGKVVQGAEDLADYLLALFLL